MIDIFNVDNYDVFENILKESFNRYEDSFNSEWEIEEGELYYSVKVLVRKKDYMKNNLFASYKELFFNHDESLIYYNTFSSLTEFKRIYATAKIIANSLPYGRVYININPKSVRKTIYELNNRVNDISKELIINGKTSDSIHKEITKLSKSITNVKECDYNRDYNWVLLDIDNLDDERIDKTKKFIDQLNKEEIEHFSYNTPNGIHILISYYDAHKFRNKCFPFFKVYEEFINNSWVEEKTNALALIYTNPLIREDK